MRTIFERIIYFVYIVSIIATFGCLPLIYAISPWFIFALVVLFLLSYFLHKIGYKHLNFEDHDNMIEGDERFDFESDEEYSRWEKLKKLYDEVGDQDLTREQKNQVRKILEEMAESDRKEE